MPRATSSASASSSSTCSRRHASSNSSKNDAPCARKASTTNCAREEIPSLLAVVPAIAAQRGNSRRGTSTSGVARTGARPPLPVSAPAAMRSRAHAMRPALHCASSQSIP